MYVTQYSSSQSISDSPAAYGALLVCFDRQTDGCWLSAVVGSVELVDVSDKLPGLVRENGVHSWRVCVCYVFVMLNTTGSVLVSCVQHVFSQLSWPLLVLQCFDAVGWAAGRASGL